MSDSAKRYGIDPVWLGAMPAESRALFKEVLGRLDIMRDEMARLWADKMALAERVTRLEEKETWAEDKHEPKQKEDEGMEAQLTQRTTVTGTTKSTRHRRAQAGPACERVHDFQALTAAAMDACCPVSGGGHRRLQASCDLPATCPSVACAAVFVPYMQDCATMVAATPGVPVEDFQTFAASCEELQAGSSMMLPATQVLQFRILVNTEGTAQAGTMFPGGQNGGGGAGYGHPLDPLQPLTPVPPPPSGDVAEGTAVTQYHAVCTSADVASCVPDCTTEHHGYELLATIDGTDTKFSCNIAHGLFSWMGAASEGGYLGSDFASFFSAVVSGAAGSYIVALTGNAGIGTDLAIQPGQDVHISGDPSLATAPSWGSGGFTVGEMGSLSLSYVQIDAGASIIVTSGGLLSLARLALPVSALGTAVVGMSGAGSQLVLEAVTVTERAELGALTGTVTARREGEATVLDPLDLRLPPFFKVLTGPCTTAIVGDQFCVGRWPGGYEPNEDCQILLTGGGGVLGGCPVFDLQGVGSGPSRPDYLTMPDGSRYGEACPTGTTLAAGQTLAWHADGHDQGDDGNGMPHGASTAGGGWQICLL